jgi:hypothetical protein
LPYTQIFAVARLGDSSRSPQISSVDTRNLVSFEHHNGGYQDQDDSQFSRPHDCNGNVENSAQALTPIMDCKNLHEPSIVGNCPLPGGCKELLLTLFEKHRSQGMPCTGRSLPVTPIWQPNHQRRSLALQSPEEPLEDYEFCHVPAFGWLYMLTKVNVECSTSSLNPRASNLLRSYFVKIVSLACMNMGILSN